MPSEFRRFLFNVQTRKIAILVIFYACIFGHLNYKHFVFNAAHFALCRIPDRRQKNQALTRMMKLKIQ